MPVLAAFEQAARERKARPEGNLDGIARLIPEFDVALGIAATRLAGVWKLESARKTIADLAGFDKGERGKAAIDALVALGGPNSYDALGEVGGQHAIVGRILLDPKRTATDAAAFIRCGTAAVGDPSEIYRAYLHRAGGSDQLAEALEKAFKGFPNGAPPASEAQIGLRVLHEEGISSGSLHGLLQKWTNGEGLGRKATPEAVKALLARVPTQGDPLRGEAAFRRPAMGCLNCHAIAGAGGRVGPDLGGIGASSQVDYLLDSILFPDKVIREGYNTVRVITLDGKAVSGIHVRETKDDVTLRTPADEEITIPKSEIDVRTGGGSLMPQGLAALVTDAELVDLVRFLSEVGKPGPFAVSHVPTARRCTATPDDRQVGLVGQPLGCRTRQGGGSRNDDRLTWTPLFARVSGEVPIADSFADPKAKIGYLGCRLDVAAAGPVTLKLNAADGLTAWLDGSPLEVRERMTLTLPVGKHELDFHVDMEVVGRRAEALSCTIAETPGSTARVQVQVVGGR